MLLRLFGQKNKVKMRLSIRKYYVDTFAVRDAGLLGKLLLPSDAFLLECRKNECTHKIAHTYRTM
jgi:hypothetical protein